jgi:predicted RNase H-like HicB family nuclease
MLLTAVLIPAAEGGFTAMNPETGTTTQGDSVELALANLREATQLYLDEFPLKSSGQPLVTTFQVAVNAQSSQGLRRGGHSGA